MAAVLQAKQAGMTLEAISEILGAADPAERAVVLALQRDLPTERIAEAQAALALVEAGLDCQHGDLATCPRFRGLLAEQAAPAPKSTKANEPLAPRPTPI